MTEEENKIELTRQEYDEYLFLKEEKGNPKIFDPVKYEKDMAELKREMAQGIKGEANKFALRYYYTLNDIISLIGLAVKMQSTYEQLKKECEALKKNNEYCSSQSAQLKMKIDELENELRKQKRNDESISDSEDEEDDEHPYY